jgi:hypothetical protein
MCIYCGVHPQSSRGLMPVWLVARNSETQDVRSSFDSLAQLIRRPAVLKGPQKQKRSSNRPKIRGSGSSLVRGTAALSWCLRLLEMVSTGRWGSITCNVDDFPLYSKESGMRRYAELVAQTSTTAAPTLTTPRHSLGGGSRPQRFDTGR